MGRLPNQFEMMQYNDPMAAAHPGFWNTLPRPRAIRALQRVYERFGPQPQDPRHPIMAMGPVGVAGPGGIAGDRGPAGADPNAPRYYDQNNQPVYAPPTRANAASIELGRQRVEEDARRTAALAAAAYTGLPAGRQTPQTNPTSLFYNINPSLPSPTAGSFPSRTDTPVPPRIIPGDPADYNPFNSPGLAGMSRGSVPGGIPRTGRDHVPISPGPAHIPTLTSEDVDGGNPAPAYAGDSTTDALLRQARENGVTPNQGTWDFLRRRNEAREEGRVRDAAWRDAAPERAAESARKDRETWDRMWGGKEPHLPTDMATGERDPRSPLATAEGRNYDYNAGFQEIGRRNFGAGGGTPWQRKELFADLGARLDSQEAARAAAEYEAPRYGSRAWEAAGPGGPTGPSGEKVTASADDVAREAKAMRLIADMKERRAKETPGDKLIREERGDEYETSRRAYSDKRKYDQRMQRNIHVTADNKRFAQEQAARRSMMEMQMARRSGPAAVAALLANRGKQQQYAIQREALANARMDRLKAAQDRRDDMKWKVEQAALTRESNAAVAAGLNATNLAIADRRGASEDMKTRAAVDADADTKPSPAHTESLRKKATIDLLRDEFLDLPNNASMRQDWYNRQISAGHSDELIRAALAAASKPAGWTTDPHIYTPENMMDRTWTDWRRDAFGGVGRDAPK